MATYPFDIIEPKWQRYWETHKTFRALEDPAIPREQRRYVLDMFPYPSAQGLHVGHPEGYTATDIYCRYLRMQGYNVCTCAGTACLINSAKSFHSFENHVREPYRCAVCAAA